FPAHRTAYKGHCCLSGLSPGQAEAAVVRVGVDGETLLPEQRLRRYLRHHRTKRIQAAARRYLYQPDVPLVELFDKLPQGLYMKGQGGKTAGFEVLDLEGMAAGEVQDGLVGGGGMDVPMAEDQLPIDIKAQAVVAGNGYLVLSRF